MSVFPFAKTCRLATLGAMTLALAGSAFADGIRSSASRDLPARMDGRLRTAPGVAASELPTQSPRRPMEVLFRDAQGRVVDGGTLRVYDGAGNLMDIARPDDAGAYTLGPDTRGKMKFQFEDRAAYRQLAGADASGGSFTDTGFLVGFVHPKVDTYADLLDVNPSMVWQTGDLQLKPTFVDGAFGSAKPLDAPSKAGGPTACSATPLAIGDSDLDVLSGAPADGNACAGFVGGGLYYSFVGNGNLVTASTCSPLTGAFPTDTIINVYTGSDCSDISCVAANDDNCAISAFASETTFCAADGVTYYVEVENWGNGSTGDSFQLSLTDAGPGPETNGGSSCDAAQSILPGESVVGNTTCGGYNFGDNCDLPFGPGALGAQGLWYTFEGTGGIMTLSTDNPGTTLDTQFRLYCEGCDDSCFLSDDDSGTTAAFGFSSEISFQSEAGVTYDLFVGGFGGATGVFELTLDSAAAGPTTPWATPFDITSANGPHDADGRTEGSCGAKGAVCIKCLDDANCLEEIDPNTADRLGGRYMGDDTTCTTLQGTPPDGFIESNLMQPFGPVGTDGSDTIVLDNLGNISNMAVLIDITHTFIGDVRLDLTHEETGTTSPMWINACGAQDDLRVIWDINGGDSLLCTDTLDFQRLRGAPGVIGDVEPFIGEPWAGNWRMDYSDAFPFSDDGVFNRWGIEVDDRVKVFTCGPANNGGGNGYDAQPGQSDNCNDCP